MSGDAAGAGRAPSMDEAKSYVDTRLADLLRFDDAACVVAGGGSGIGAAIARRFAEQGARVTLVDRDSAGLDRTARAFGERGLSVTTITGDVLDGDLLDRTAAGAMFEGCARLVWVNSAGIYPTHLLSELDDASWQRVIDINLTGTMRGSRAAAGAMRAARATGVIVNLSSVAGSRAGSPPGIHHYAASKHAVEGLTKSLAVELGPEQIRVVAIAPGVVVTEGLLAAFGHDDEVHLRMARAKPLRRPSLPDDVARTAVFLASAMAAMLTGCVIPVDGGHTAL